MYYSPLYISDEKQKYFPTLRNNIKKKFEKEGVSFLYIKYTFFNSCVTSCSNRMEVCGQVIIIKLSSSLIATEESGRGIVFKREFLNFNKKIV